MCLTYNLPAVETILKPYSSLGTSIISPAQTQLMQEFDVSSTVAFLPLTMYVLSLGLGPILGGPLSETAGRRAVYIMAVVLGGPAFSFARKRASRPGSRHRAGSAAQP